MLTGYKWKKKNLTYGFQYRQWNDTQKSNVVSGLKSWEKACGLTFTKTGFASASLKFHLVGNPSYPYLGNAFFPVGKNKGKIFISYNNATDKTFKVGGYDYITVIHEVGHALGLAHPHGVKFPGVTNPWTGGKKNQNIVLNTVMGYNDLKGPLTSKTKTNYGFVAGPMAYDVNAIQHLYGRPSQVSDGNTTYNMSRNYFQSIVDTGGTDTIVSTSNKNTVVDLRQATVNGKRKRVVAHHRIKRESRVDLPLARAPLLKTQRRVAATIHFVEMPLPMSYGVAVETIDLLRAGEPITFMEDQAETLSFSGEVKAITRSISLVMLSTRLWVREGLQGFLEQPFYLESKRPSLETK